MSIKKFGIGDTLVMKKKHPCGADTFKVTKGGSDIRIVCSGCGRDILLPRISIEKSVKRIIAENGGNERYID